MITISGQTPHCGKQTEEAVWSLARVAHNPKGFSSKTVYVLKWGEQDDNDCLCCFHYMLEGLVAGCSADYNMLTKTTTKILYSSYLCLTLFKFMRQIETFGKSMVVVDAFEHKGHLEKHSTTIYSTDTDSLNIII